MKCIRESIVLLRLLMECISVSEIARRWADLGEFLCSALDWQGENR